MVLDKFLYKFETVDSVDMVETLERTNKLTFQHCYVVNWSFINFHTYSQLWNGWKRWKMWKQQKGWRQWKGSIFRFLSPDIKENWSLIIFHTNSKPWNSWKWWKL